MIFNLDRPDTMGIYFHRAFQELGHAADYFTAVEAAKIPPGYDLYVRIDDDDYTHGLPPHAHPSVYYLSDVYRPHVFRKVTRYGRQFDCLFCPMQPESARLRQRGFRVEWLNPGCDLILHRDAKLPRTYDVAFVGTEGPDPRRFYLQLLRERYPNSFMGRAPHQQLGAIYSRAKIGFSFPIRRECLTMRSFEVMAAGALLLMPRLRDDSIERSGFTPGEHLVTFDRPSDLLDLMDHYVHHEDERERIAAAGQRLTLQCHTYRHRVLEILKATESLHK